MEHLVAKLLEDLEHGKISRRQLIESVVLAATAMGYGWRGRSRWGRAHSWPLLSARRTGCASGRSSGSVRGCALKARGIQSFETMIAAKLSSQPRTESCVVSGNGHCEA